MNVSQLKNVTPVAPKRLSLKELTTKGRIASPIKALIYGEEGAGKSTFAAGAPRPIFISFDNRTNHLDITRVKPRSWDETLQVLALLEREGQDYDTVVLDPLGWLETQIHLKVTGDPLASISSGDFAYGRGAEAAMSYWRIVIDQLDRLWEQGKNIILVAHREVKAFDDPRGPKYDRFQVSMKANAAGRFRQWVDYVIFAEVEVVAKKTSATGSMKASTTDRRFAHLKPHGAYDAKFSGSGPACVDLSWRAFYEAVTESQKRAEETRQRIWAIAEQIGDPEVTAKLKSYVAEAGEDGDRLEELANAAANKLAEVEAKNATQPKTKEG